MCAWWFTPTFPAPWKTTCRRAGRAGRDRALARCVLLYTADDVERQFGLSARSRLSRREIQGILKALRNLDRKKRLTGEVVATSGEILGEDEEAAFERDSATDDTRVRTAISWLEEAQLLTREENRVQVFPSSLRVDSVDEARRKLAERKLQANYRASLLAITKALIDADPDEGVSTDELVAVSGLTPERVRHAMFDLEALGIASNDTALTAFVHVGVPRASRKRLAEATALEGALIEALQETAPDMQAGDASTLHLRLITQRLKDAGHAQALPERIWRLLRGIAGDGRNEGAGKGSLGLRRRDPETVRVTLQRPWKALAETALRRRAAGQRLLEHLLGCLPPGIRGTDLLAETTLGKLMAALQSDLELKAKVADAEKFSKLLDRALLWLHEQEIVRLNKGVGGVPPRHVHPLGAGEAWLRQYGFQAAPAPLPRSSTANPCDGGVCAARPAHHGGGAGLGDGLLQPKPSGLPAPLAAGQGSGLGPPDHRGVLAQHCGEPEEPRPATHRRR